MRPLTIRRERCRALARRAQKRSRLFALIIAIKLANSVAGYATNAIWLLVFSKTT